MTRDVGDTTTKSGLNAAAESENPLEGLRYAIDELDSQLLELLNRRMELAQEVGRLKAERGLPLFHPGREEAIFQRLSAINRGPLSGDALRSIYLEIFAASRLLQYVLRVAFLGPEWTHSHLAARSLFGHAAQYLPSPTLEDVFENLQKGKTHTAVIPIENSLQGGIGRSMDLLYEHDVQVTGECYLEIAHYLVSLAPSVAGVRRLYAHPQAVEQCRRWLLQNLPHVDILETPSTAHAALKARGDAESAAICNLYAAHHHGLGVLAERIEDQAGNTTRFLVLSQGDLSPSGHDKTSLLFAVSDRPGALHSALEVLAHRGVNMTHIESRPNRVMRWQYLFFADVEGYQGEEPLRSALRDLGNEVTFLKVLGSYPRKDPCRPIRVEKEKVRGAEK